MGNIRVKLFQIWTCGSGDHLKKDFKIVLTRFSDQGRNNSKFASTRVAFSIRAVTYIRVTRNSNKIPILNSNHTDVFLTQVNEGNSISFIYTFGFYRCFGIHSVISLLFT